MLHILISRMIYITDFLVVLEFSGPLPTNVFKLVLVNFPPKKVLTKTIVDTTNFTKITNEFQS